MTTYVEPPKATKPLISRSSILILSGALMGLTFASAWNDGLAGFRFYSFLAAFAALLAFVGLDAVGQRRRRRAERRAREAAAARLEQRFNRHIREPQPRGEP